jgi:hypothetical protein
VVEGGIVRVERSCLRDNRRGGIQVTNGGTAIAVENVVQHNIGEAPEHGLLVGVPADTLPNALTTRGNVVRFNGARGISVVNNAQAVLRDDVVANNYFTGLLAESTEPGVAPSMSARGLGIACNYAPNLCENQPGHVCRDKWECTTLICNRAAGRRRRAASASGCSSPGRGTCRPASTSGSAAATPAGTRSP